MRVLDLDMDYFMDLVVTDIASSSSKRLSENDYGHSVWPEYRVRLFLEKNLGLSKAHKLPGRIVTHHNEALFFWEELLSKNYLTEPFEVIHVDSHADLGLGYPTSDFLQSAFLTLPIETRRKIRDFEANGKIYKIDIGDYLLWGIAYGMFSKVVYCSNPNGDNNDYCLDTLKDFREELIWNKPITNYIQLTYNKNMDLPYYDSTDEYIQDYLRGAIRDPEVEFKIIPTIEDVKFSGNFDYVTLSQSPNYTPSSADYIIDILREYIIEI